MYLTKKSYWPILLSFDIIGNVLFFYKRFKKKPDKIRKVLFIRLEHIGDMILSTSTFETFKKNNPNTEIHVLCKPLTEPLIKNNPYVSKVIIYDNPWYFNRGVKNETTFKEIVKILKKENYDMVFEMHGDPRNNYLASKIGVYTIGYACRGGGFFLNKTIEYDPNLHIIKQNLKLVNEFCKKRIEKTNVYTDESSEEKSKNIMNFYDLKEDKFIILNPISGRIDKDLTKEEVERIIKKYKNYKIIFTGSIDQSKFCNQFKGENIKNLCGKTDLLTLAALVKKSRKVIAPDTGIIHIAKAVGTDFEAIYKTTDENVWGYHNS